jgi:hypothetical protein
VARRSLLIPSRAVFLCFTGNYPADLVNGDFGFWIGRPRSTGSGPESLSKIGKDSSTSDYLAVLGVA